MKNISRIIHLLLKHWGYVLSALFFIAGFALFSGVSITMLSPLFDYVFNQASASPTYTTLSSFWATCTTSLSHFISEYGIMGFTHKAELVLLQEEFQTILSSTAPMLLLWTISGVLLILTVLKNIFFYGNRLTVASLQGLTIKDLRTQIFNKYLNQSLAFFTSNRVGDSQVRITADAKIVGDFFIGATFRAFRDIVNLAVLAIIALCINPRLFLLGLVLVPVFSLTLGAVGKKIKKYAKRIQAQYSNMFSKVEEILSGILVVKSFARENYEKNRFRKINEKYFHFWRRSISYSAVNVPLSEINSVLTGLIVLLIGGRLVLAPESTFTIGHFTAFLAAIFSMLHPMKTLTKAYTNIKKALVSLNRICEILDRKEDIVNIADPVQKENFTTARDLQHVHFSYQPSQPVLQDISLTIHKGERIALVGSSGSGKSTLSYLLPRLYDVTAGSILIDNIPISTIALSDLRQLFGIVTQKSILFNDSIANNVRYGALYPISDTDIEHACNIAYAKEFIEKLPEKYDAIIESHGGNFSGGQLQRICIARAIVGNPPILIFDEATSSLDTEAEQFVQQAIENATQNRTVILIAHRLSTVLSADKILVLDKGKMVGLGTHKHLLQHCSRYQTLYNLQFADTNSEKL